MISNKELANSNLDQQSYDAPLQGAFLNGWITCVAFGTFLIDKGQQIEVIYPENSLTIEDKKSIQMVSFPDTQCISSGNDLMLEYCFRMKVGGVFQLGFVQFIRKKDPNIDRGFVQKSLTIVTKLPLINFFQKTMSAVGQKFYEQTLSSAELLQKIVDDMNQWPAIEASKLFVVPFLGQQLSVSLPSTDLLRTCIGSRDKNSKDINSLTNEPLLKQSVKKYPCFQLQNDMEELTPIQQQPQVVEQKRKLINSSSSQIIRNIGAYFAEKIVPSSTKHYGGQSQEGFFQATKTPNGIDKYTPSQQDDGQLRTKQRSNSQETGDFREGKEKSEKSSLSDILKINDSQEEGLFQEINIFQYFQLSKLHALWAIWEIVLLNLPILVTANSPSECSAVVLGLISLISPIEFAGDYRPYFTVYDPDYKKINLEYERHMLGNYVLGTCNPLFHFTFKSFPAIVGLDSKSEQSQIQSKSHKVVNCLQLNKMQVDIIPDIKHLDKLLVKSNSTEANAINNSLVRKHFRLISTKFLQPIEEFLKTQPTVTFLKNKRISNHQIKMYQLILHFFSFVLKEIKYFEEKKFIEYLKTVKVFPISHLYKDRATIIRLYHKFLRSVNFLKYVQSKSNVKYIFPLFSSNEK